MDGLRDRAWLLAAAAAVLWIGVASYVDDLTPAAGVWFPAALVAGGVSIALWWRPTRWRLDVWSGALTAFAVLRGLLVTWSGHVAGAGIWSLMALLVWRVHRFKRTEWR